MQVRKISLSKLQKADMPSIMDNIIKVLKEHDVEKLHLDFMLITLEKAVSNLVQHKNCMVH